jgi:hypothetical protein
MSRTELEQFVDRFEKAPQGPGREASVLEGTQDEDQVISPDRKFPGLSPGSSFSKRSERRGGSGLQEVPTENVEGARTVAPARVRSRYESYLKSLSRTPSSSPAPRPTGTGTERP